MTGFSARTVANWSSGKVPGPSAQKKLTELTRLFDALSDLVDPSAIAPCAFFAFSTFIMKALARLPVNEGIAAMQSVKQTAA